MMETWPVTLPTLTGDEPRLAYCYVPDTCRSDPGLRLPVLYMFDGHNVFFDSHATYGKSWGMLEYLERTGTPIIVAAVECNHDPDNGRLHEYSPYPCEAPGLGKLRGKGKATMDWLTEEFKPYIDSRFPTLPGREHTFIAGSSMGGLMSLYAVTKYNKFFSRAAALSPSVWFGAERLDKLLRTARLAPNTVIYMDYGSREMSFRPNMAQRFQAVADILLERGIHLTLRIVPGGNHNEASWERQIPFFINTLLYGREQLEE